MTLHSVKRFLAHGLALEPPTMRKKEDERFIAEISSLARKWRLEIPLSVFLEGLLPLSTVVSSAMTAFEPAAEILLPMQAYRRLTGFVGSREKLKNLAFALTHPGRTNIMMEEPGGFTGDSTIRQSD